MSSHWTFYAFDPQRFRREACDPGTGIANLKAWLAGAAASDPDAKLLTTAGLDLIGSFNLDYNLLPRKHWRTLDAYYRLYFRELMSISPESPQATARENWDELLRFYRGRNGQDTVTFSALAGEGSRTGLLPRPTSWMDRLTMTFYGAPSNYLLLEGEALHTFCRHLQALFYVNSWDWPTYLEDQETLRPRFVNPFLNARDGAGALYALRSDPAGAIALRELEEVEEVPI